MRQTLESVTACRWPFTSVDTVGTMAPSTSKTGNFPAFFLVHKLAPWAFKVCLQQCRKHFYFGITQSHSLTKLLTHVPPVNSDDSCRFTVIFPDIDWDRFSLSLPLCCTVISSHFFTRHWWVPRQMMVTFPQSPSNSSNILPITRAYSECIILIFMHMQKDSLPSCVPLWKWNSESRLCLHLLLRMVRRPDVSLWWRVVVNKTRHRNKTLVPITEQPLIIRLSSCIYLPPLQ